MMESDPDELVRRLAAESLAVSDPTGWFEQLYAAAQTGEAVVPWDRGTPNRLLVRWAEERRPDGAGRSALVTGCGLGDDAEYIAGLGFDTVAFDVAASAVRGAEERFPRSAVRYRTADLLDPPAGWRRAFDLVFESMTVQALPAGLRREATARVGEFVRPGGSLVVIAAVLGDEEPAPVEGPPWPLSRADIELFGADGLQPIAIERLPGATAASAQRWLAEFTRTIP